MQLKSGMIILLIATALSGPLRGDENIASIQQALKDQGFYYGAITGEKDADTTAAIRRYQIRNGLTVTGELNDETRRSINAASTAGGGQATPSGSAAPRSNTADTSDLRDDSGARGNAPDPNAPSRPFVPLPRDDAPPGQGRLVPSAGGLFAATPYETAPSDVQRRVIADAQRQLARRGLFKDEIDGAYGPALEFSLRAYQSRVGLRATGRLDLETLAALELLPGAHAPVFTPRRPLGPPEPVVRGEWVRP